MNTSSIILHDYCANSRGVLENSRGVLKISRGVLRDTHGVWLGASKKGAAGAGSLLTYSYL